MEFLQNIDTSAFYFINGTLSNTVFDTIMPFITESDKWLIVFLVL